MVQDDYPIIIPLKGRSDPAISPVVILIFTIEDFRHLRKNFRGSFSEEREIYNATLLNIDLDGVLLTLVGPIIGAPHAVLILEKLIAMGAETFLALGWCGSISPDVRIGDIVIPVGAVSEEGTSAHYPVEPSKVRPCQEIVDLLLEEIRENEIRYHLGYVWSTDAPYREMASKVLNYRTSGVLAVDMETSALLRVSAYRGVKIGVVLVVSDELFTLKWKPGFRSKKFVDNRKLLANIMLNAGKILLEKVIDQGS